MPISEYLKNLRERVGGELLLLPGVCALVFNEAGEILLQRRSDNGNWAVIGGLGEPGEEPADTAVREVYEETGVRVVPERISGVYATPVITYPNGDRTQYIVTTFFCRPVSGSPCVNDDESLEVRYFPLDQLPPISPHHRLRIEHALRGDVRTFFVPPKV